MWTPPPPLVLGLTSCRLFHWPRAPRVLWSQYKLEQCHLPPDQVALSGGLLSLGQDHRRRPAWSLPLPGTQTGLDVLEKENTCCLTNNKFIV